MENKRKEGLSRLFELAGKKKGKLFAASIFSVISSFSRIIFYFSIYLVIKTVLENYSNLAGIDKMLIVRYSLFSLAGIILYAVCAFVSSSISHVAAYDLLYEIRIALMEKMSRISAGFFDSVTQGSIKKIMADDVESIEEFIAHSFSELVAGIAAPLFIMIYLFTIDWRLSLIILLPIIISIFLLGMCLTQKDKALLQKKMSKSMEKMTGTIIEYVHGMSVIKVFNRSLKGFKRYENDINEFVDVVDETAHANALPISLYYVFFGAQTLFLLPPCIFMLKNAAGYNEALLTVILFLFIGQGLKEPLENMMNMAVGTNRIKEAVARIDNILYQNELPSDEDKLPSSYDVAFENVSFSYNGKTNAVEKVSFKARPGSINAIVGHSGGGKSTLMELLLRFYDVNEGAIKIGGVNIKDISQENLMSLISYVFQDSFLFNDTIENNIRMGNQRATKADVVMAAKAAGIHEVIERLPDAYDSVVGENNVYLSGGEKQRIAIARLFLKDSPIVVLDEATAYADAENETKIQAAFARLAKNKTVFIIAHRLKTIENADNILVIHEGRLAAEVKHSELMEKCQIYKDMVAANERRDSWSI